VVESTGALPSEEIIQQAFGILQNKLDILKVSTLRILSQRELNARACRVSWICCDMKRCSIVVKNWEGSSKVVDVFITKAHLHYFSKK